MNLKNYEGGIISCTKYGQGKVFKKDKYLSGGKENLGSGGNMNLVL